MGHSTATASDPGKKVQIVYSHRFVHLFGEEVFPMGNIRASLKTVGQMDMLFRSSSGSSQIRTVSSEKPR